MKKYKNIEIDHELEPTASHQPALIWAVENSGGDVLELGCGLHSTRLLHHMTTESNKKLTSVEDNLDWMKNFTDMANENHTFILTKPENWKETIDSLATKEWGIVFVDQGATKEIGDPARIYSAQKLVNCADYVIVHDADCLPQIQSEEYNWHIFYPKYIPPTMSWRKGPPTYILSKKHSLKNINIKED